MKLSFLGACRQVGRSMVEADCGETSVLLDSGASTFEGERFPRQPRKTPDAAIVTHAHFDHSGYLPLHYKHSRMPWFCTFPTHPLANLLWHDSIKIAKQKNQAPFMSEKEIKAANAKCVALPYGEQYELFDGTRFTLHNAGHIAGSAQVVLESGDQTLVYTGDLNTNDTRMHLGTVPPVKRPNALVIESTYADSEHPPRDVIEKEFVESVSEACDGGGNALIPCFATGRTQEILQVLHAHGVPGRIVVDGMGEETSTIISDFPSYVRDHGAMTEAIEDAKFVESTGERRKIAMGSGNVIISTAGMMDGGPVLTYLREMNRRGKGSVLLTGFQIKGTNARRLVEEGKVMDNGRMMDVKLPVRQFDFSAHAGKSGLLAYVKKCRPGKVFCIHGEDASCVSLSVQLSEMGFDAEAPKTGDVFTV